MLTEEDQQQLDNSLIEPGVVITIKKDKGEKLLTKVVPKGDPESDSEKNVLPKEEQPQETK